MVEIQFNRKLVRAKALEASASNPNVVYFATDSNTIIIDGTEYASPDGGDAATLDGHEASDFAKKEALQDIDLRVQQQYTDTQQETARTNISAAKSTHTHTTSDITDAINAATLETHKADDFVYAKTGYELMDSGLAKVLSYSPSSNKVYVDTAAVEISSAMKVGDGITSEGDITDGTGNVLSDISKRVLALETERKYMGIVLSSSPELPSNDESIVFTTSSQYITGAGVDKVIGRVLVSNTWYDITCADYSSQLTAEAYNKILKFTGLNSSGLKLTLTQATAHTIQAINIYESV